MKRASSQANSNSSRTRSLPPVLGLGHRVELLLEPRDRVFVLLLGSARALPSAAARALACGSGSLTHRDSARLICPRRSVSSASERIAAPACRMVRVFLGELLGQPLGLGQAGIALRSS